MKANVRYLAEKHPALHERQTIAIIAAKVADAGECAEKSLALATEALRLLQETQLALEELYVAWKE